MPYKFTGLAGYGTRRTVVDGDAYLLYDAFDSSAPAGSVNGTLAEPVGGVRTVVDTNGKIIVSGGLLSFATGAALSDRVDYSALTRRLGQSLLSTITPAATTEVFRFGWTHFGENFQFLTGSLQVTIGGTGGITVGAYTNTAYQTAIIQRTAGAWYFIKGGLFTNWTLAHVLSGTSNGTTPSFGVRGTASIGTFDDIRVPKQTYIPVPLQSDGMSATTTDGLGNPENNGIVGTAYEDFGTWGVSGGVRSCSVLGGATGSSVLATSTKNVHIEVNVVRSAGFGGITARRADSSNYIRCTHDGTNVVVTQVIAGTPSVLSTTAVAYLAGATLKFDLLGTAYRAIYNNTAGGSGTVTDTESTNHGLITSGTANTFDNLVIWAKESYTGLNAL